MEESKSKIAREDGLHEIVWRERSHFKYFRSLCICNSIT